MLIVRLVIVANPEIGIVHSKYKPLNLKAGSIDNHKLSDRNEGEGRFGNRARLQHTQRHLTAKEKTSPFHSAVCIG